jgi:acetoacetate decarboxylase
MSLLAQRLQLLMTAERRKLGFYTLDLPITEELPLVAGREIWGVPKFLADISLNFSNDRFRGEVLVKSTGEKILSLESSFNKGIPFRFLDSMVYSNHQDSILKIISNFSCSVRITRDKEARLEVGSIDHRMAHNLRDLDLNGATPFLLQSADKIEFILNEGIRVMTHPSPPLPYGD